MNRRSFFRRTAAAVVVAVASPMAIVAPQAWERVKRWRNGYLTPEQADRFIQLVLDKSPEAKVVPMSSSKLEVDRIRFGRTEGKKLTNRELVEKAIVTTKDLA